MCLSTVLLIVPFTDETEYTRVKNFQPSDFFWLSSCSFSVQTFHKCFCQSWPQQRQGMFSSFFKVLVVTNSKGVSNRTLRDVMDPELNLLMDDGYNNSKSLVRADRFDSAPMQKKQRGMKSVVESAISYTHTFGVCTNRCKIEPEFQGS